MPTVLKKAFVIFMLLVLVINQTVPVSALQNRVQVPVLGLAAALVTRQVMQREMGKKAASAKLVNRPPAPEPAKVRIKLSASPKFITGAGIVTVSWSIAGDVPAAASLQISFPDGYIPGESAGSYDAAAHTLSIPAAATSGLFPITIQNPVDDAIFPVVLFDSAGKALAQNELALPRHEKFSAKKNAGSALSAENGRVKVRFGKNSLSEDVTVNIGAPTGEITPDGSLSGQPFEIDAQGMTSKTDLHQFADEINIDVDYSKLDLRGNDENNLYLYYYSPDDNNWVALPTTVDTKTKTMHAITTHFTVFDSGINNFQASRLPTVDSFQVSSFTGAATYDLPIEVPAGRSGLQPNLDLSYNSQMIDQSTAQTQASWVGMGWSLGMNSIELDDHGTNPFNNPSSADDTWSVNVNGISSTIVLVGGAYRAADQNFVDFSYDSTNDTWTVQDKQGNSYYFTKQVKVAYVQSGNSQSQCRYQLRTYQWYLTRMENVFGQALTYSYVTDNKPMNMPEWETGSNACRNQVPVSMVTATYPDTITYPGGGYRIRFVREDRPDLHSSWIKDAAYHNFQRSRLNSIWVEQGTGNGPTFSNYALIRKYVFEYASTSPQNWATTIDGVTHAPIWPGITWDASGKTSTLLQVHQFDGGGNELPTATFSYEDQMHLTRADNGYGGSIHFTYEPWAYPANARMSQTYKEDFNYGNTCDTGHFAASGGQSVVECIHNSGNGINMLKVRGTAVATQFLGGGQIQNNAIRPGGFYKFGFKNVIEVGANTDLRFKLGDTGASTLVYHTNANDVIPLDVASSKVDVFLQATNSGFATANSNYVTMTNVTVQLLTSIYRVTTRTIDDGQGNSYDTQYAYSGAAVNDSTNSDSACDDAAMTVVPPTCQQYYEKYAEFRGHSSVTETDPDGHKIITTFNQDDVLKGRVSSVTTKDVSGKTLSQQLTNYTVTHLAPVVLVANGLFYNDMLRYWARIDTEENRVYDNVGGYDATQTTYAYEGLYGNLLSKAESFLNDSNVWELFRTSEISYASVGNGGPYLNSLPIIQQVKDKTSAIISQTAYLYDNHPAWNMPPANGIPTGARVWVNSNGNYSQVSYGYDAWGNRTTTSSYSTFSTLTTNASGSPITQTTDFDPIYHTYPVGQHTPAMPGFPNGFTTTIAYDYNLGLPISQTSNGDLTTKVTAHYDGFGRLTSLVKPGDSDASPTFQVAYNDVSQPFRIDLRQKIDNSNSYILRHSYDGLGREIKTETGHGSNFASFTLDSQVDSLYLYDNVAGQSIRKQSTPHLSNEAVYYSVSYADALGRPVKIVAPDGSQTKYSYNGLSSTVMDANQHATTTVADVWGRTLSVTPPTGPGVSYTYDPLGQLLTATRGGLTTSITYDRAGRKTKMVDPDMGTWYYKYDAPGNMIAQVDAAGQAINLYYDLMNRLKGKTYATTSDGNTYVRPADPNAYTVSYTYDAGQYGIGKRTGMSANAGADTSTWTYDVRGRATREHKVIDGQAFDTDTSYNNADLPLTITYPDGEIVSNHYNARMMLDTVAGADPYITATAYDSAGRMTSRTLGNGVKSDYTFNAWNVQGGRLLNLTTSNPATQTALQNITYTYDAIGNIKSIADMLNNQTQTFNYDSLDRLTQAYTTGSTDGAYSENYSYDPVSGNLKTRAGSTLYYDDVNHKHAVTSMGTSSSYTYDPDGNQIQRTVNGYTYKLDYDPEGHLISVTNLKTPTAIASPSATITGTASPSGTPTVTSTASPAETSTVTETAIASPSGTVTSTASPAVTDTAVATDSPSETPVPSATEILTLTPTASPSGTATESATQTATETPTDAGGAAPQSNLFLASYRQSPARILSDAPLNTFTAIKTWAFSASDEGWTDGPTGTSNFGWQVGGTIGATVTGGSARVFSPTAQSINITSNKIIKLRYKNSTASTMGYLYFMTGSDTAFGGSGKIMSVALASNSNYTEYTIDASNIPAWTGTLTRLRFDIGAVSSGSFAIDYVQIGSESATPTRTVTPTKTTTPAITPTSTPGGVAEAAMQFKSLSAQFRYDGDGNMVKAVMDGVTTIYVNPMYQVKADPTVDSGQPVITKYYPGGAIRTSHSVSSPQGALGTSELSYALSDHLGSTSLTTDASGAKVAEMRYKPWGEVRFANGDPHTDKTYTGQRSYASDFGLMYYNARWYDTQAGRFAQADTVVPNGVQGYDRYAYVDNNPVMKNDPSGHSACDQIPAGSARDACSNSHTSEYKPFDVDADLAKFGVTFDDDSNWTFERKYSVYLAVILVAAKLATTTKANDTATQAFRAIYGGDLKFTWGDCPECKGQGAYTYAHNDIHFVSMAQEWRLDYRLRQVNNVIHELGHAFSKAMGGAPDTLLTNDMDEYKDGFNTLLLRSSDKNLSSGFASPSSERTWVQNPATSATEVFGDQFLGWVRNTWETDRGNRYGKWSAAGSARATWMTTNMTDWLNP